ncbi:tetratricopeptide (TPR) repeat protein [Arthrobacter sp. UYP6]|uniref:helix-turn-helix transcriptional regulator n=1 Tax=Arthrobacter sp. UYP6 TaxID=1756378 RepID=UPI00339B5581
MGKTFGNLLALVRKDRRLTQEELGGDVVGARDVSLLEKGRREPSGGALRFLAERLCAVPGYPPPAAGTDSRVFLEFTAAQAWDERDYRAARRHCLFAADAALADGDPRGWWELTFMAAGCLRRLHDYPSCLAEAEMLAQHALAAEGQPLRPQAEILLAAACQGSGRLPDAVRHARRALELGLSLRLDAEHLIEAYLLLIAALSESGLLEEAWGHCQTLVIPMLEAATDPQTAGKGFWAVGNVAFRRGDVATGLRHHAKAESLLTPDADLEVWAAFNRASAAMRLAEGLHDAATSDCMTHAETALSVVGATEEEVLENLHSRGRWQQLLGQHEAAVQILADVYGHREVLSPQGAAEVALHLGLSRAALGGTREAVQLLNDSAAAFYAAGALDRASHASRLADRARSGAPVGLNERTGA